MTPLSKYNLKITKLLSQIDVAGSFKAIRKPKIGKSWNISDRVSCMAIPIMIIKIMDNYNSQFAKTFKDSI